MAGLAYCSGLSPPGVDLMNFPMAEKEAGPSLLLLLVVGLFRGSVSYSFGVKAVSRHCGGNYTGRR